ncbi:DUF6114 domain-containing protein [Streptomyces palmae]|uniref:DUF6114 domain-containing protein n=1 Tax=Streptomyces palmae TaxID=1701085 RepID=UPI001FD74591|nr:DUF6114 domain-containing protein [Streptomyces palmae]
MLLSWRRWRRGRPFWGGLATVLAGAEISSIPLAPLKVMILQGVTGMVSVLLGLVLIVLGLSAWFAPHYRGLAGVLTVMVSAASLVLSNLGGFFVGTIIGVIGGSLIFGWQPLPAADSPQTEAAADADPGESAAGPGTDGTRVLLEKTGGAASAEAADGSASPTTTGTAADPETAEGAADPEPTPQPHN